MKNSLLRALYKATARSGVTSTVAGTWRCSSIQVLGPQPGLALARGVGKKREVAFVGHQGVHVRIGRHHDCAVLVRLAQGCVPRIGKDEVDQSIVDEIDGTAVEPQSTVAHF